MRQRFPFFFFFFSVLGILVAATAPMADGLTIAPGLVVARTYWELNPSTGESIDKVIPEFGFDVDVSYTFLTRHSACINASIGGGGPSGALPLTYAAIGVSYQFGHKRSGWAVGPTFQLTFAGPALGAKLSYKRIDVRVFGSSKYIAAFSIGVGFGTVRSTT